MTFSSGKLRKKNFWNWEKFVHKIWETNWWKTSDEFVINHKFSQHTLAGLLFSLSPLDKFGLVWIIVELKELVLADDCVLFDDCCTGVSWSWGLDCWIGEFNWWIGESKLVESSIIFNEVNKVISSSIWKNKEIMLKFKLILKRPRLFFMFSQDFLKTLILAFTFSSGMMIIERVSRENTVW